MYSDVQICWPTSIFGFCHTEITDGCNTSLFFNVGFQYVMLCTLQYYHSYVSSGIKILFLVFLTI